MASEANVQSVEQLQRFHMHLVSYLDKADGALCEATMALQKERDWLQHDQRQHWARQIQIRERRLEEAEQALMCAKLSKLRETQSQEKQAVMRAKHHLEEARSKLQRVKHWLALFEARVGPKARELTAARQFLQHGMRHGTDHLKELLARLQDYQEAMASPSTAMPEKSKTLEDLS